MNEFIILIKIVILLVLLYVSWEIYRKVEKNKKLDKELQHYPPEKMSCIDFSLIYRGYAERTDIPVIVIELANKGYLKIQAESESQDINSKTVIRIQKLKNYDGDNINERIMFNSLFKNDRIVYVEELNSDDISGITLNKKKFLLVDSLLSFS